MINIEDATKKTGVIIEFIDSVAVVTVDHNTDGMTWVDVAWDKPQKEKGESDE